MANGNGVSVQSRRRAQPHAEPSVPLLLAAAAGVVGGWYLLHRGVGAPAEHQQLIQQLSVIDTTSGDTGAFKLVYSGTALATGDQWGVAGQPVVPAYPVPFTMWLFEMPAHGVQGEATVWGPFHVGTYGVYYSTGTSDAQAVTFLGAAPIPIAIAYTNVRNIAWGIQLPASVVLGPIVT